MRIISLEKKKEGIHLLGAFFFYAAESAESRFPQKSGEIVIYRLDFPKILGNLLYVSPRLLGH